MLTTIFETQSLVYYGSIYIQFKLENVRHLFDIKHVPKFTLLSFYFSSAIFDTTMIKNLHISGMSILAPRLTHSYKNLCE